MSIDFVASYDGYVLKDAIVGTAKYITSLTADEINTIKINRFNAWYDIVSATPIEETPNVEELVDPLAAFYAPELVVKE